MTKTAFMPAVQQLQHDLEQKLCEVAEIKKLINSLHARMGEPEPYENVDEKPTRATPKIDRFMGFKTPSSAAHELLKERGQAVLVDEMYEAMKAGGYTKFAKDDTVAVGGLRVALAKDARFLKHPSLDAYGLAEWYGRTSKRRGATDQGVTANGNGNGVPEVVEENDTETAEAEDLNT